MRIHLTPEELPQIGVDREDLEAQEVKNSDDPHRPGWHCPTCSGTAIPPSWVAVKGEWDALSDRERVAATHLLFGLRIYSGFHREDRGPCRGWKSKVADAIRALLPTFWDAWDVADDGVCVFLVPDEEDAE